MTYQRHILTKTAFTPGGPSANGSAPGIWRLEEVAYWQKQGVWPNSNILADTNFRYVSLLLSTTALGNANNNLFVDSSGAFNPISRNGNVTQASVSPYSPNWSNYFDGNGDYLSTANSSINNLGTSDFTIELWFKSDTGTLNTHACLVASYSSPTSGSWAFKAQSGNTGYIQFASYGPSWNDWVTTTNIASDRLWHHCAVTRSGNTLRIFVDGAVAGSWDISGASSFTGGGHPLTTGFMAQDPTSSISGNISNVRIVKGTALYTSAFTPPTAPLTAISGTAYLTCQSNRFRDASTSNAAITTNGDVKVTSHNPFPSSTYTGISYNQSDITNWSGFFNGGTDRVQVPVTSNMYLGTTYTIEAWAYYNSTSYGARPIFSQTEAFQGGFAGLNLTLNTSGQLVAEYRPATSGSVTTITGPTVTPYTWFHIALVCDNSSAKLYVNGAQVGSTTTFGDYPSAKTSFVAVGSWGHGWNDGGIPAAAWIGYISNLRVVKGVAVYTSNFTPSTTPLTAVNGTVLLTCQNAAFTDNSSVKNILTPISNATVTGNSPFNATGYWSNRFSSGNYLTVPNSTALNLSGGAYTIEMWINPDGDYGNYNTLVAKRVLSSSSTAWEVYLRTGTGVLSFYNGLNYESSVTPTAGVWSHVAAVYDGTGMNLYLNGTRVLQSAVSNNDVSANIQIGTFSSYDERFIGNMSNLRITKGAALYSGASFTPPTGPLTTTVSSGTVSLLTCQSSRFIDNSANAATITVSGTPSIQSFDPFYTSTIATNGGSMYFDGNGDYLVSPSSPATAAGSSDLTIECWVTFANPTANSDIPFYGNYIGSWTTNSIYWGKHTAVSGRVAFWINNYSTGGPLLSDPNYPTSGWHHYAVTRSGSTWRMFRDGVVVSTATWSGNASGTNGLVAIGRADVLHHAGYIADFRFTKSALYTSSFTPPTAPLTASGNTGLLVNGMNAGIYDAAAMNTIETVGNTQVSTVQSKFGGSSVYFDGNGDWLDSQSTSEIAIGGGDFTIEAWIYPTGISGTDSVIFDFRNGNPSNNGPLMVIGAGTGNPLVYVAAGSTRITGSGITLNTWSHVAVSRSGTSTRMFLNGTQTGSTYTDTNNYASPVRVRIGADDDGSANAYFIGYIDEFRVTKGVARYTANFTPPTQAFPLY